VRDLTEADVEVADLICRVAFGTFLGVPEPETFFGDADYVGTRLRAPNTAALAAVLKGEVVGSNFVTDWGSVGFFGPLSVRVDLWDGGVASRLMETTMSIFSEWDTRHATLFTWSNSPKHHGLYQKFGFYPTFLTAVMSKPIHAIDAAGWSVLSRSENDAADECREITGAIYPGLDLAGEIRSVLTQQLGDVVLIEDGGGLAAFAVCHIGQATEAGSGTCFVKFAAARPGAGGDKIFARLIDACELFGAQLGAERLVVGANMGRLEAYKLLCARGFRTDITGVAMQQAGDVGYNRSDVFVIDDWR
jgi:predicted N-acetyltransferase YhbS